MSAEYQGKSDAEIIAEQEQQLNAKSGQYSEQKFQPRDTITSDESGVSDAGVQGFPGASVSTGRTGQTGGGTNPQIIPPEEGGEGSAGTSSAFYEDPRGGKSDIQADIIRNDPSADTGRGDNVRREGGIPGARPPQELTEDQLEGARSAGGSTDNQ